MATTYFGVMKWELERDDSGGRSYMITSQVRSDDPDDGPLTALLTEGLAEVGDAWAIGNDVDDYAWCTAYAKVRAAVDNEQNHIFFIDQRFTTRPMSRCNDASIGNPTLEPAKVSGGFTRYVEEARFDRFNNPLVTSSYEPITGKIVEIERGRPTVRITKNYGTLPLATFCEYRGAVNSTTMWGLPERTVRLADITWERNIQGVCGYYYTITYEFEIKFETWNRYIVDQGKYHKLIKSQPISASNPLVPEVDTLTGRWQTVYLDGSGGMVGYTDAAIDPSKIYVLEKEIEKQYNFFTLEIPAVL